MVERPCSSPCEKVYNRTTMLKALSVFMAWVLCLNSGYAAKAMAIDVASQGQVPVTQESVIQKKLSKIPVGSSIEVQLTNNEKHKGQLEGISAEGIILKLAIGNQVGERKIAFSEMKSIKAVKGSRVGLYVLASIGVFAVVVLILVYGFGQGD